MRKPKPKKPTRLDADFPDVAEEHEREDAVEPAPVPQVPPLIDLSAFDDGEPRAGGSTMGDLISLDPVRLAKLREKGHDVVVSRVRFEKWTHERGKVRVPGEYPPELVNADWVLGKWGPGLYEIKAVNSQGMYLGACRANLAPAPSPPARENGSPVQSSNGSNGNGSAGPLSEQSFMQQLVLASLARPQPVSAEPEPMRQVVGSIAQLMALQLQTQSMQPKTDPVLLELLKEMRAERATKKASPSFTDVLPILQLGLGIGARMGGNGGALVNPDDAPGWLKMVPQLADTVGVPLVLSIAQALLPPDKAKGLLEAVEKHMAARQAEAAADIATSETDDEPEVT